MSEPARSTATLLAGPYDGVTISLSMAREDLPHAVVLAFAVEDAGSPPVWHSYAFDRRKSAFRYLGAQPDPPGDAERLARPDVDRVDMTRQFYDVLLERHPSMRPLFPADLGHQALLLRDALSAVLRHLDDPEWLTTRLGALGARHASWGVTAAMYVDFCDCMIATMTDVAGEEWTGEEEQVWRETLEDISSLMLAGAAPPQQ